MSRLIDADALFAEFENVDWYNNADRDEIAERLVLQAPIIDAVSVVRCAECMFSKVYQNDSSGVMGRFCEAFTQVRMVTDDDFCSYGEKETDHE